ncbi:HET-domain-containing protein [Ophiobolus disseminans]|uniref:HET-domain-containing protein n=1 Tax=Ophiobolus disseminans TaxID=1469910 RepID=A0A6A6ZID8_9PLEO|nr:HET-domain-containing protein [Ophiobolus disseminans]
MYSSLNVSAREVRLLHLHPGAWNDDINCQLQVVSLDDGPRFNALSYVWGAPQRVKSITVDGENVLITQSLFTAFQRIRHVAEVLVIWADALCINQNDLDDRSQQVQLMGDIYSSAEEVLIWLGYGGDVQPPRQVPDLYYWTGDNADDELVNTYIERSQSQRSENDVAEDILGAFVFLKLRASNMHLGDMPFFEVDGMMLRARKPWQAVFRALKSLSSLPWWNRLWVLQETVLARKATVIYNHTTAPWDMLALAAQLWLIHDNSCCEDLLFTRPDEEQEIIIKARRVIHDTEVVRSARAENARLDLDATDVRDKVYGLLGMVTDWYGSAPIPSDYALSAKEVFMRASLAEIQGSYSLQVLMGTPRTDVPKIPSWVTQSSSSWRWRGHQESRTKRAALFRAAGQTLANAECQCETLIVDGFNPIDTVAHVGLTMFEKSALWEDVAFVVKGWRQIAELDCEEKPIQSRNVTKEETFWKTMVNDCIEWHPAEKIEQENAGLTEVPCDFRRLGEQDPPNLARDWWRWLQSQVPDSQQTRDSEQDCNNPPTTDPEYIRLFDVSFLGATVLRKFFITTSGRMGLGPPATLRGDKVVILLGGDTPFLIRSGPEEAIDDTTLIGDAYIHGLMDGEGIPNNWRENVVQISIR